MNAIQILYPATSANAALVRGNLKSCGAAGARVRKMRNGSLRIVLANISDREPARDALVLSDACTGSGEPFTSKGSNHAWNGPTEIFVRFLHD